MSISRNLAIFSSGKLPDLYLFNNGKVSGYNWQGSNTNYASYTISNVLKVGADIGYDQVWEGAHASLTLTVNLTDYKKIYFVINSRDNKPSITVGGTSVSTSVGTQSLDISTMTGNKTIQIYSGNIGKTELSGRVTSGITVSKVWLSNN